MKYGGRESTPPAVSPVHKNSQTKRVRAKHSAIENIGSRYRFITYRDKCIVLQNSHLHNILLIEHIMERLTKVISIQTRHPETDMFRPGIEPRPMRWEASTLAKSYSNSYLIAIRNIYIWASDMATPSACGYMNMHEH